MDEYKLEDFPNVLIVEGYSDLLFYAAVLKSLGKENAAFIKQFYGKSNITRNLDLFVTPQLISEKARIGVIADADYNPAGTFEQIRNKLEELTGQVVPNSGAWTNGNPCIGALVVPNMNTNGEIETLVWNAWSGDPPNAAKVECINTFIHDMGQAGVAPQSPSKALVSAFLAVANDSDPRLGPGARENLFNLELPLFAELRGFLNAY